MTIDKTAEFKMLAELTRRRVQQEIWRRRETALRSVLLWNMR